MLFSVEGDDLYSYKVVHVTGTSKLIEVPVEEKHVPNVYLSAAMVSDANFYVDTKQVVVPPVEQFLAVAVKADQPNGILADAAMLGIRKGDRMAVLFTSKLVGDVDATKQALRTLGVNAASRL